ncbi:splicing factor 1 isoform X2 [Pleurodeles waltl]|uniref:splicing factor 1 isoform X2 n=2 Tax=Pleurodeles waltl TaxID=8319 RepID=UPI003709416A
MATGANATPMGKLHPSIGAKRGYEQGLAGFQPPLPQSSAAPLAYHLIPPQAFLLPPPPPPPLPQPQASHSHLHQPPPPPPSSSVPQKHQAQPPPSKSQSSSRAAFQQPFKSSHPQSPPPRASSGRAASPAGGGGGGGADFSRKRKRSRWNNDIVDQKTIIPGMPTVIPPGLTRDQERAYIVQLQIEDLTRKLRTGDLGIPPNPEDRSPSPEPIYNSEGKRLNTREFRTRKKLEEERHNLITEMVALNPDFKPPADYKPPATRVSDKVMIPQDEYPEINFVGLLIGPRGNTLKNIEKECNAKIMIRGKGSVKEGKVGRKDGQMLPGEDEPLHALVTANTMENVKKAVEQIRNILKQGIETPEDQNDLRKMQLRELARLNGTLREDDNRILRPWQSTEPRSITNTTLCTKCGGAGHIASDCKFARPGDPQSAQDKARMDKEYLSLMAELGEAPVPSSLSSIGSSMGSSIGGSMGSSIGGSMGSSIGGSMGSSIGSMASICSSMGSSIGSSMGSSIGSSMGSSIGSSMGSIGSSISSSMGSSIGSSSGASHSPISRNSGTVNSQAPQNRPPWMNSAPSESRPYGMQSSSTNPGGHSGQHSFSHPMPSIGGHQSSQNPSGPLPPWMQPPPLPMNQAPHQSGHHQMGMMHPTHMGMLPPPPPPPPPGGQTPSGPLPPWQQQQQAPPPNSMSSNAPLPWQIRDSGPILEHRVRQEQHGGAPEGRQHLFFLPQLPHDYLHH